MSEYNEQAYTSRHRSIMRKVRELEAVLKSYARAEEYVHRDADAPTFTLAEERADLYIQAARVTTHVAGFLEEIETQAAAERNGTHPILTDG